MLPAFKKLPSIDFSKRQLIQELIDQKTKPIGSLGRLEELALQACLVQDSSNPQLGQSHFLLFAADHGLAEAGVSPYPQSVTREMMRNFIRGGAAINVLCRQHGIQLELVDCGIVQALDHPEIIDRRLGPGTRNMLEAAAMTREQCEQGLGNGYELVNALTSKNCRILGLGEMGIGNSSAASLIAARILDLPASQLVCPGAGCDELALAHKQSILEEVLEKRSSSRDPLLVMQELGGFELVTALGAMFGAAENRMLILIDGLIMTSVALLAYELNPDIKNFMIFTHRSASRGHQHMLSHLQAKPLLEFDMRLGEGSGAALAYPLICSALAFYQEMASFSEAEVSQAHGVLPS